MRPRESIRLELIETYDFRELRFEAQNDDRILYEGVDFMGNHVWIKVVIGDRMSMLDWDVYEQDVDGIRWEEIGTVSCERE